MAPFIGRYILHVTFHICDCSSQTACKVWNKITQFLEQNTIQFLGTKYHLNSQKQKKVRYFVAVCDIQVSCHQVTWTTSCLGTLQPVCGGRSHLSRILQFHINTDGLPDTISFINVKVICYHNTKQFMKFAISFSV